MFRKINYRNGYSASNLSGRNIRFSFITSSNIKYIDNQLVTVSKVQMICKCKYKTI